MAMKLKREIRYALLYEGDNVEYINSKGEVLELQNDPDAVPSALPPPGGVNSRAAPKNYHAVRASLSDELLSSAVIKLVIFADSGVVNLFKDINSNNEAAAKTDIVQFFTLVVNEMTIIYQTLRQYGNIYCRGSSTGYPQNFAVQLMDIVFPTSGGDFAFSAPHVSSGKIKAYPSGALNDFTSFIASYSSSVEYDHAAFITGYDMYGVTSSGGTSNILGVAWMNTLCSKYRFGTGYHSSASELSATVARTFAHELGHGFGINHDVDLGCPDSTYIMGQAIVSPSAATQSTYFKFSSCSSSAVMSFTNSLSTDFRPTCLLPTDSDFFADFCKGVRGMTMTLDKQCQRTYGVNSYRCDLGGADETFLDNNFVTRCVKATSGTNPHPFYCRTSSGCWSIPEVLIGTKCSINGEQNKDNVCFNGQCQSVSFCDNAPPAPEPTTTTPKAPTTTPKAPTTTQKAPTTTPKAPTTTPKAPTTTPKAPTTTPKATTTTPKAPTTTPKAPTTTPKAPTTTPKAPTTTPQATTTTPKAPTTTPKAPTTTPKAPTTTQQINACSCYDGPCCRSKYNNEGTCCEGCGLKETIDGDFVCRLTRCPDKCTTSTCCVVRNDNGACCNG